MAVQYRKNKNALLFERFADENLLNVSSAQNYIPLYERFFELNSSNWQNVTLYHLYTLTSVVNKMSDNLYTAVVADDKEQEHNVPVFFKYSPLLDPNRYITGYYQKSDDVLPVWNSSAPVHPKMNEVNNAAYIDSFFYYLSSRLKQNGFVHGLDFYGSYLGYKNQFKYVLEDDVDYVLGDDYFRKHHGALFTASVPLPGKQSKIAIGDECDIEIEEVVSEGAPRAVSEEVHGEPQEEPHGEPHGEPQEEPHGDHDGETIPLAQRDDSSSEDDSSRSSNSDDNETRSESSFDSSDSSYDVHDDVFVHIHRFPVQVIAIEACKNTLDSLLDHLSPAELTSCLFQVVMMLITYQSVYKFTHNDLHTNNIMYVETEEKVLRYFVEDTAYEVPTFGKIYKIIDFGRSIYTFEDKKFASDSFSENGDATSQYNTEPFFDPSKERLEPNYSFDLCRLACSMVDMLPETEEYEQLNQLIEDWCCDDKGRNIVYKRNGEERYPGFKLYKMIARTVHKHVPLMQLRRPIFQQFIIKKKKLKSQTFFDMSKL